MKSFCISLSENALNKLLAKAYEANEVQTKLKGDTTVDIGGPVEIDWCVSDKPSVSFQDIDSSRKGWSSENKDLEFTPDMFTINAPVILKTEDQSHKRSESTLPLEIVAVALLADNAVSFKVVGLMVDNPSYSGNDKGLLKGLCTTLVNAINDVLGFKEGAPAPHIFTLEFLNSLGVVANNQGLQKSNGKIDVWGNSDNRNPYEGYASNKDFSVIISNDLLKDVLNKNFQAHMSECHGSTDIDETYKASFLGHFGVRATITAGARNIICESVDGNDLEMGLSPDMNFDGTVVLFGADAGKIGYDYSFNPDPISCQAEIDFSGTKIHCELCNFKSFGVLLTPTGSLISKIESGVLWALSEAVTNFITGIIPSVINIPFDVDIPAIDIKVLDTVKLRIIPTDLGNHSVSDSMAVEGSIDVTRG